MSSHIIDDGASEIAEPAGARPGVDGEEGSGDLDRSRDASTTTTTPPPVHDLLALGEIESALSSSRMPARADDGETPADVESGIAERLPLLLRWLSVAQPLASPISSLSSSSQHDKPTLPDPNTIVPFLEDAAAAHTDAENVEVLVSSVAPSICRYAAGKHQVQIPLSRTGDKTGTANMGGVVTWNSKKLDIMLQRMANPVDTAGGEKISRKRPIDQHDDGGKKQKSDGDSSVGIKNVLEKGSCEIESDADMKDCDDGQRKESQHEQVYPPPSFSGNDSHQSVIRRALQELLGLVRDSLRHTRIGISGGDDREGGENGAVDGRGASLDESNQQSSPLENPGLTLASDSLFAEADEPSSFIGGGWSNLAVIIPILMQQLPILRHEHVANALCRSAAPQASKLIMHMAANCPSCTQNLLRGCITAYHSAKKFEHSSSINTISTEETDRDASANDLLEVRDIVRTAVESVTKLASLSRCEALNISRLLKDEGIMDGLLVSLMVQYDSIGAAAFIVEKLSASASHPAPRQKGTVSLRQRMVNNRFQTSTRQMRMDADIESTSSCLSEDLIADRCLAENVRRFISQRIISLSKMSKVRIGEAALFVRAYAVLVCFIGMGAGSSAGSGSKCVEDTMTALGQLLSSRDESSQELPSHSSKDHLYKISVRAALITCCRYPPIGESEGPVMAGAAIKACFDCLDGLLRHTPSLESALFASHLAGLIIDNDVTTLKIIALKEIAPPNSSTRREGQDQSQMAKVCGWLVSKTYANLKTVHGMGLRLASLAHDSIVAIHAMQRSTSQTENELDELMRNVLSNPSICEKIIQRPHSCRLLAESVKMLLRRPAPHIPLVLPLSLERLALSVPWDKVDTDKASSMLLSQLSLQIVYAMNFLDCQPTSPFAVNPRHVPLRKALAFLKSCHDKGKSEVSGHGTLHTALKVFALRHCGDIVSDSCALDDWHNRFPVSCRECITPQMVFDAICNCVRGGPSVDPSGLRAESVFVTARSIFPHTEVDVAAAGAILGANKSHPPFISYIALCRDPIALLKSPASIWRYRGLRQVIIRILQDLMDANECLAIQDSVNEGVTQQMLLVRDTIIFKSILFVCASGFDINHDKEKAHRGRICMTSVNLLRSIVSKRRGVVAALLQDIPRSCIDWMAEWIPECLLDAQVIVTLLSERRSMTATERLTTASAGLRIAVANSSRGGEAAKRIVSASTEVLLDSFPVVVGPVGVPVSVLREEKGDVTKICKHELFRMIRTLSFISPKEGDLKNEAIATLSKVSALCKSEQTGGMSGAAASRKKTLLREIWEAASKANTSLGEAAQM